MEVWDRCSVITNSVFTFKLVFEENECLYQKQHEGGVAEEKQKTVLRTLRYHEDLLAWCSKALYLLAYNGEKKFLIEMNDLAEFIFLHQNVYWVTYAIELEFYVVSNHLCKIGANKIDSVWRNLVRTGKMKDVLIIDSLVRLAISDDTTDYKSIKDIALSYEVILDENSTGKILKGNDKEERRINMDNSFHELVALFTVFPILFQKAIALSNQYSSEIFPHAIQLYGPLSETIQVKGTIALSLIEMTGFHVDKNLYCQLKEKIDEEIDRIVKELRKESAYDGLFKTTLNQYGSEELIWDPEQQGRPSINQDVFEKIIEQVVKDIDTNHGIPVIIPKTSQSKTSKSRKVWADYEQYHDFLKLWLKLDQYSYYSTYLKHIKGVEAHPKYTVFVRNGRTSCSSPPIQQTSRTGGFREMYTAHPGYLLVTIDYNFIELCTLAQICEQRYGHSTLARVIREGIDPHAYTASIFSKVEFNEFMKYKDSAQEEERIFFKTQRQKAKAINFGIPSGLSSRGLEEYARSAYGVEFTKEEAIEFISILINVVYPELSEYLRESEMETLAENLGCRENQLWNKLCWKKKTTHGEGEKPTYHIEKSPAVVGGMRNVIKGMTVRDGKEYNKNFVDKIWNGIEGLVQQPDMYRVLTESKRQGSEELYRKLLGKDVVTLTGRVRGKVGFTQSCNTPFSGLAADGAKLALWNLTQVGFRIVCFVHDEIVLEIPENSDWDQEVHMINKIVCSSMKELTGTIPIKCDYTLSRVWSKEAQSIYSSQNKIQIWEPKKINILS